MDYAQLLQVVAGVDLDVDADRTAVDAGKGFADVATDRVGELVRHRRDRGQRLQGCERRVRGVRVEADRRVPVVHRRERLKVGRHHRVDRARVLAAQAHVDLLHALLRMDDHR
uniref:Uncharacterized protein n=1 Tax=Anopheles christyi TaxID=43041 RepID=A0A182KJ37_9DIPT